MISDLLTSFTITITNIDHTLLIIYLFFYGHL